MQGPPDDKGVNLRAVETIFELAEREWEFQTSVVVSMLEVYNDRVLDLLESMEDPLTVGTSEKSNASMEKSNSSLEVRKGADGVFVEGIQQWLTNNAEELQELVDRGTRKRSVGCNNVNEHSSRSHLVVLVKVIRSHYSGEFTNTGVLYLVDLAGSERIKFTAAKGSRLKEAQHINKSLSALGDVISALASGSKHVPYRNSKLTYLLQDVLNENSHVLMIVNITAEPESVTESTYSLQFASRCRSIKMGVSRRNVTYTPANRGGENAEDYDNDNQSISSKRASNAAKRKAAYKKEKKWQPNQEWMT
eukprot:CAMPEP_0182432700 /NCGR_PEP_ID=MMETSP1167-20130531/58321_1 /TAXON_ID=2988 /ORGANISM="Mallomonas Sp, Strain CCMP3275" /LENGTH=305 /DNA_ID=CAMNT_0024620527 /DNA_START=310 /DNA_END=1227 /DNA_ORIENTATION=-